MIRELKACKAYVKTRKCDYSFKPRNADCSLLKFIVRERKADCFIMGIRRKICLRVTILNLEISERALLKF